MKGSLYPNIDAERARKGLSAEDIAAELKISRKTYYNWVNKGNIPQKKVLALAEYFDVSADYLLQRVDDQPTQNSKEEKIKEAVEMLKKHSN